MVSLIQWPESEQNLGDSEEHGRKACFQSTGSERVRHHLTTKQQCKRIYIPNTFSRRKWQNPMDRGAWWATDHGVAELDTT